MTFRFRILLIVAVIIVFYYMFNLIKRGSLQLKYSLLWIVLGVIMLIMAVFPKILDVISKFIGIYTPTNALFLLGFAFTLPVIFGLTMAISKLSMKVKDLAQELALLSNILKKEQYTDDKE